MKDTLRHNKLVPYKHLEMSSPYNKEILDPEEKQLNTFI